MTDGTLSSLLKCGQRHHMGNVWEQFCHLPTVCWGLRAGAGLLGPDPCSQVSSGTPSALQWLSMRSVWQPPVMLM